MPTEHEVEQGEGISSLAERYGFSPQRIWDDPANDGLRRVRPDPEVLLPGDVVVIPDKVVKKIACRTGRRHVFKRTGVPARFSLQLLVDGAPRAGEDYTLTIGDRVYEGTTDDDGVIEEYVSPRARQGVLVIGSHQDRYEFEIGTMDPIGEVLGIQKRLNNLGFDCSEPDGELDGDTVDALRRFQAAQGLEPTGETDEATIQALEDLHDTRQSEAAASSSGRQP